jgi:H/ACA ribonucleoprotein complex subunit 1
MSCVIVFLLIISELGVFQHAVEGEMLCESNNIKIPYFNAPIYLENKVSLPSTP